MTRSQQLQVARALVPFVKSAGSKKLVRTKEMVEQSKDYCPHCNKEIYEKHTYHRDGKDYHSDCDGEIEFPEPDWNEISPEWRHILHQPKKDMAKQAMNILQKDMNSMSENFSQPAWNGLKSVANFGSYMLPGVGTARYGYDAYKDFRKGNYLSGAGNVLGAGLSLLPGIGGGAAKLLGGGLKMLGVGGKMLGAAKFAPNLARGFGKLPGALEAGEGMLQKGVSSIGSRIPGVSALAKTRPIQMMNKHPGMTSFMGGTMIPGMGIKGTLDHAQEGVNEGKEMTGQAMPSSLSQLRMSGYGMQDPRLMSPTPPMSAPFNPMYSL